MRRWTWRRMLGGAGAVAMAVIVAGCSPSSMPSPDDPSPSASKTPSASGRTGTPTPTSTASADESAPSDGSDSGESDTGGSSSDASGDSGSSSSGSGDSASAAVRYGWGTVAGGDEFAYTGAPSSSNWSVYDSVGHAGNGVRSPSAFSVSGGVVRVSGDANGTTGGMAARFDSSTYGKWEVRMRVSQRDPKYHPVLLLWPNSNSWPCDGEVDFAEGWAATDVVNFVLISGCEKTVTRTNQTIDQTAWHNYAVEWNSTTMIGYIDGVEFFRDTTASHLPPGPMHLCIQLDWFPDGSATSPSWMEVDWVRFYR
ncbi:MAG: glycoside hydrolase family 16 protein [Protaetiibacter sp.]